MFISRLEQLTSEKNITIAELGKGVDIPPSTLYSWQKGSQPTLDKIVKLADYFGCSLDYLTGRENDIGIIETNLQLTPFQNKLLAVVDNLKRDDQYEVLGFAQGLAR